MILMDYIHFDGKTMIFFNGEKIYIGFSCNNIIIDGIEYHAEKCQTKSGISNALMLAITIKGIYEFSKGIEATFN